MRLKAIFIGVFIVILLMIETVAFAPSCVSAANILRIGIGIDADSLNPHETTTTLVQNICELMYDTLYSQNEKGELVAKLATEKSISKDGLSWTFKLRKGVKFHDGTPFTAEAVKAGLDRVRDPKVRAPLRFYTAMIDKVEVVDDSTVKILLKHPYGPLEWVFTQMVSAPFSPKAIRELGEKLSTQPVGTGPFKLGEWVKGERIVLVRNEEYYGKKPSLERIILRIIPEHGTRTAMLRAGDLDMIVSPQPPDVAALEKDPNLKVVSARNSRIIFVGINNEKEIFKDRRVRQAFNYAVDKDTVVKKIMLGLADVEEGPMPSCFFGFYKVGKYEYNPQKAKDLLAAAKFPMDTKISMISPTGRYTFDKQVAEAVQAYLNDIGLQVELRTYDWPTYMAITFKPVEQNEVQLFLMGWGTTVLDPDFLLMGALHSSAWAPKGMNTVFYKNAEVDKLFEEARISQDSNNRKELYKKASIIIWNDAPMIFLYEPKFTVAYRKNVKGIEVLPVEKFDPVYATLE
jgi:peptide/nickel transport system substrate-binding protein